MLLVLLDLVIDAGRVIIESLVLRVGQLFQFGGLGRAAGRSEGVDGVELGLCAGGGVFLGRAGFPVPGSPAGDAVKLRGVVAAGRFSGLFRSFGHLRSRLTHTADNFVRCVSESEKADLIEQAAVTDHLSHDRDVLVQRGDHIGQDRAGGAGGIDLDMGELIFEPVGIWRQTGHGIGKGSRGQRGFTHAGGALLQYGDQVEITLAQDGAQIGGAGGRIGHVLDSVRELVKALQRRGGGHAQTQQRLGEFVIAASGFTGRPIELA